MKGRPYIPLFAKVLGWLLDHGFSYTPVLVIAGSLHILAFGLICVAIPNLQRLVFAKKA